jgi:nucleoside-diphosphate-sugar epimerase
MCGGSYRVSVCLQMIERFNGRMPGYPGIRGNKFSFCHIDDVVVAFLAAIEMGKPGERYLLCGDNVDFHEVFDLAASVTNTRPPRFTVPTWLMDVTGFLCVQWARFGAWTGISRHIPFVTTHVSITKLLILLTEVSYFSNSFFLKRYSRLMMAN